MSPESVKDKAWRLVRQNWKKALSAGLVAGISFAAGAYTGPVGGKIAGGIAGKVIPPLVDKLPDTPITDVRNKIREKEGKPPIVVPQDARPPRPEIVLRLAARERSMIADAAKDHGATLRWECTGIPVTGNPMLPPPPGR